MTGQCYRSALLGCAVLFAPTLGAQSTAVPTPTAPRCYQLIGVEWSRSLGVNAGYHAIPPVIRLDTARAGADGWKVSPDIAFPTPNRRGFTPRWTFRGDSIEILWSDGFQATTVRLGATETDELRGTGAVRSDANEFRGKQPHATIVAHRVSCAEPPSQ